VITALVTLALVAVMTTYPITTHAGLLHEVLHLKTHGNNTLLVIAFKPLHIGNYGYATVYLTYNGVYAYGLILLKRPDKPVEMYVMAGDQNHWYGPIIKKELTGHIVTVGILVLQNKTLYYNVDGDIGKCNLTYLPPLTTLHIVVGNVTGRGSPSPSIVFNRITVYVSNATLTGQAITDIIVKGSIPQSMTLALSTTYTATYTTTSTTTTTTQSPTTTSSTTTTTTITTTTTTTSMATVSGSGIPYIGVVIVVIGAALILLLWRKQARRAATR